MMTRALKSGMLCSCLVELACGPTFETGREALEQGRLRDAEHTLVGLASKDPEAKALLEQLRVDKRALIQAWLKQAAEVAATPNGHVRALSLYRTALALLDPSEAEYAPTLRIVTRLDEQNRQRASELGTLLRWVQTKAVLKECAFNELEAPLNRMIQIRNELSDVGVASRSLLSRLLELVSACFMSGQYESAAKITEVAERSRLPLEQLTVDDETRRELSKLRTPGKQPALAQEVLATKTDNEPEKQRTVRRESRPQPVKPPDPLEVPYRFFSAGRVHEALLALDRCAKDANNGDLSTRAAALLKDWQPERVKLIAQYLATAEQALGDEDSETAFAAYSKILELEPQHQVANDRARKLQALRKLRNTP